MADSRLDGDVSPQGLDERSGVVRLNRYPLLLVLGLAVVVLGLLIYSIYQRGAGQGGEAEAEAVAQTGTGDERKKLLAGYENVDFIQPPPEPVPLPVEGVPAPATDAGVGAVPAVAQPPEMSEEERLRLQQERELENYRREAMMRALTAPTVVDNGKSAASGGQAGDAVAAPRLTALEQLAAMAAGGNAGAAAGSDANGQAQKEQFTKTTRTYGYSDQFREQPLSENVLRVGSFIPAVMVSGINSDLPGEIIAQVSQDVRDTPTGNRVLIPQGTKIIGSYSNRISYGQERVLLAWSRLSFPDGSVLELGNMGGMDEAGYAGVTDQVDRHTAETFKNATLISMLSAGAQLSQGDSADGESASAQMAAALGQQWSQVGMEMVKKGMERQPTLTVRPGFRFNVFINKDLLLEPYRAKGALVGGL